MSKQCKICKTNNPDTANYCAKCGQPLNLTKYTVVSEWEYGNLKKENNNLKNENARLKAQLADTWMARAKRRWKKIRDEISIGGVIVCVCFFGGAFFFDTISSWVSSLFSSKETVEIRVENGKYGLFNHDEGRQTLPCEYDTIIPYKSEETNFYLIYRQGHWGLVDHTGVRTVDCMLDSLLRIKSGLLRLYGNGKQGLADWQGNVILPCTYHRVLWEGNPAKWAYFYEPGDYVGNILPAKRSEDGLWTLHDRTGKRIVDDAFRYVAQSGSPDLVRVSRKYSYRDWGLVDTTGSVVVPQEYLKYDLSIYGDGRAWKKDGKAWVCMDEQGKTIYTLPADKRPDIYSEGLCVVYAGDFIEYYDTAGKRVIPPKYKTVKGNGTVYSPNFWKGRAYVSYNGQPGYIDKQGNFTEKKSGKD